MVVLWGNYLRYYDMPSKGHHWHVSYADLRQEVSNQHYSGGNASLQHFHHILPIPDDLPMSSYLILLDAESTAWTRLYSPSRRVVHPKMDHRGLDLRTWSPECSCRLDTGHPADFPRMEFEHESTNKDLGSSYSSPRSCVRLPSSMHIPITN